MLLCYVIYNFLEFTYEVSYSKCIEITCNITIRKIRFKSTALSSLYGFLYYKKEVVLYERFVSSYHFCISFRTGIPFLWRIYCC